MHSGAEIPVVQGRRALGSKHRRLVFPDAGDWLCPELEPHAGPHGARCPSPVLPQPDVPGGSGHICWQLPPGTGGGGAQLPSCSNDKMKLAVLFLKLNQLRRQRQSVLFSLHWKKSRCDRTYSAACWSIEKLNSSSKCVTMKFRVQLFECMLNTTIMGVSCTRQGLCVWLPQCLHYCSPSLELLHFVLLLLTIIAL